MSIKKYKLKWGPLEPIRKYQLPYNQILKLTQHSTKKS